MNRSIPEPLLILVARVLATREHLRTAPNPLLLAVPTLVIGVALVLLRQGHAPAEPFQLDPGNYALAVGTAPIEAQTPITDIRPVVAQASIVRPRPFRREAIDIVLQTARAQIGKPYSWGAVGPRAFDCSGFTRFVWAAAGVYLPHGSASQYAILPHVSLSDLQPGDLIFSGNGHITHVGLYIGRGLMINSPETGSRVRIQAIHSNNIGAARPALLLRPAPLVRRVV